MVWFHRCNCSHDLTSITSVNGLLSCTFTVLNDTENELMRRDILLCDRPVSAILKIEYIIYFLFFFSIRVRRGLSDLTPGRHLIVNHDLQIYLPWFTGSKNKYFVSCEAFKQTNSNRSDCVNVSRSSLQPYFLCVIISILYRCETSLFFRQNKCSVKLSFASKNVDWLT